MRASITFLIIWFVFILMGFGGSVLMHYDERSSVNLEVWFQHDIIYALVIGWILAGLIILYMYGSSTAKKDNDDSNNKGNKK